MTEQRELNKVGAEVLGDLLIELYGIYYVKSELLTTRQPFDPINNLNHTDMVLKEMCKKGWHILTETTTDKVTLKKRGGLRFTAKTSLPDKGRRIMEAVDKAIESEKGE